MTRARGEQANSTEQRNPYNVAAFKLDKWRKKTFQWSPRITRVWVEQTTSGSEHKITKDAKRVELWPSGRWGLPKAARIKLDPLRHGIRYLLRPNGVEAIRSQSLQFLQAVRREPLGIESLSSFDKFENHASVVDFESNCTITLPTDDPDWLWMGWDWEADVSRNRGVYARKTEELHQDWVHARPERRKAGCDEQLWRIAGRGGRGRGMRMGTYARADTLSGVYTLVSQANRIRRAATPSFSSPPPCSIFTLLGGCRRGWGDGFEASPPRLQTRRSPAVHRATLFTLRGNPPWHERLRIRTYAGIKVKTKMLRHGPPPPSQVSFPLLLLRSRVEAQGACVTWERRAGDVSRGCKVDVDLSSPPPPQVSSRFDSSFLVLETGVFARGLCYLRTRSKSGVREPEEGRGGGLGVRPRMGGRGRDRLRLGCAEEWEWEYEAGRRGRGGRGTGMSTRGRDGYVPGVSIATTTAREAARGRESLQREFAAAVYIRGGGGDNQRTGGEGTVYIRMRRDLGKAGWGWYWEI
ncbi:hypothetical protein R3P38DRAFT_2783606 [Favolaschia claudopus]|uniref:Uncharacterized protein n=1 Tax=Favolaschia claudopus TaxID=2862362 RepID=A0AAW0AZS6_9AGAR